MVIDYGFLSIEYRLLSIDYWLLIIDYWLLIIDLGLNWWEEVLVSTDWLPGLRYLGVVWRL